MHSAFIVSNGREQPINDLACLELQEHGIIVKSHDGDRGEVFAFCEGKGWPDLPFGGIEPQHLPVAEPAD